MNQHKVISVNVGAPRQVDWQGKTVTTSIFKEPVAGRVKLGQFNIAGDQQADLAVHGGLDKAVYVYPAEYYEFWERELARPGLGWGMFGENLTVQGLLDTTVNIGDRFSIGTAEVMVTEPRVPCYKLNLKFGRSDMIKRMAKNGYTGFYLAVLKEGELEAGDQIIRLGQTEPQVKVADISRLYLNHEKDLTTMQAVLNLPTIPQRWKDYFQEQIAQIGNR